MVVSKVNLQDANFPSQVEAAVRVKAREDRSVCRSRRGLCRTTSSTRAAGVRRIQEAEGYRGRVVANAEGEASRFEQLSTNTARHRG